MNAIHNSKNKVKAEQNKKKKIALKPTNNSNFNGMLNANECNSAINFT